MFIEILFFTFVIILIIILIFYLRYQFFTCDKFDDGIKRKNANDLYEKFKEYQDNSHNLNFDMFKNKTKNLDNNVSDNVTYGQVKKLLNSNNFNPESIYNSL